MAAVIETSRDCRFRDINTPVNTPDGDRLGVRYLGFQVGERICAARRFRGGFMECLLQRLSDQECPFAEFVRGEITISQHNERRPKAKELNFSRSPLEP